MQEESKGALQPGAQSGKGAGGNGNGSGNGSDDDRRLLNQLQLTAFSADPPGVPECSNATSTLSWNVVETPETTDADVQFQLLVYFSPNGPPNPPNGSDDIGATGSLSVTINSPWRFDLVASLPDASKVLGTVTIGTGGNSKCSDTTWPCDEWHNLFESYVIPKIEKQAQKQGLNIRLVNGPEICGNKLNSSYAHAFSIDSSGFHIVEFLTIPGHLLPPYFIDVNLDLTVVLAPYAQDCELRLALVQFSADADYPPEVDILYPGLTAGVENFISSNIEGQVKPALSQDLGAGMKLTCGGLVNIQINNDGLITFTCCQPLQAESRGL